MEPSEFRSRTYEYFHKNYKVSVSLTHTASLVANRRFCHLKIKAAKTQKGHLLRDGPSRVRSLYTGRVDKLKPGSDLLSHGETPHYHRRCLVSLPSSRWDRVVPKRCGRREN